MVEPRNRQAGGTPAAAADLLLEIGCEELPPRALDELRGALFTAVSAGLEREHIAFNAPASRSFSTPRRLALLLIDVQARQPDQEQERRGPSLAAAYDKQGQPTGAALGFARSLGLPMNQLETLKTDKGQWLIASIQVPGKPLDEIIFPVVEQALRQLPVPRPMRWAAHEFSFVRPVHWLVLMHGSRVINGTLLGQAAGNTTRGHRIHAPGPHPLAHAQDYVPVLKNARVLADQDERKAVIEDALLAMNAATRIDAALLCEVNNLVEWPVAIDCSFDPAFLAVPHEALIASMQDHQKFFPILTSAGSSTVTNRFIAVANLESRRVDSVREGFERVIRPRLADARFFLEQDQKKPLHDYIPLLDGVVFQKKIGSVGDKSRRIASISRSIAAKLDLDAAPCEGAACLAKCDLLTQMVGEFPELQGTMGRYYALHSGEPQAIADAIEQHYLPRFAGDDIPRGTVGQVVGLADRIDTLVAIFAAGLKPTGNKDPFALRRSALGLVRILSEGSLELSVERLLALAANELNAQGKPVEPAVLGEVQDFIIERARTYFRDAGHGAELVSAALASDWGTLPDLHARLKALGGFLGQPAGLSLAAANKRTGNILRKADVEVGDSIDEDRLILSEERDLYQQIQDARETLDSLLQRADYAATLQHLSKLAPAVDRFFDAVMVMDEDVGLRNNRLALLSRLKGLFDRVADLSVLG